MLRNHPTLVALQVLLPDTVVVGGSFAHILGDPLKLTWQQRQERMAAARVEATRWCEQQTLRALDLHTGTVGRGEGGEPTWPQPFVGSISRAGTVTLAATTRRYPSLGIDVECATRSLDHIRHRVAPEGHAPGVEADMGDLVSFSVREALFKAQFPLTYRRLDFEEATLEWAKWHAAITDEDRRFHISFVVTGPWVVSCSWPFDIHTP